jgi:predicted nuclease of restriction endonuclease-like (RecB) superfamily
MKIIENSFSEVLNLIKNTRNKTFQAINNELINLYWNIGEYISRKVITDDWGNSTVKSLSEYIIKQEPSIRGFSSQNIWRMKQFYEEYREYPELSTLLREISWSSNLHILSKTKTIEEKVFYINLTIKEKYSVRELERQIDSCYFERSLHSNQKLSTPLREIKSMTKQLQENYKDADKIFRDHYLFEFLDLPDKFTEKDLQKELIKNIKVFLLELGKDFSFIGENYRLQVGNKDYYIDILFYHRELQCLVAFELKIDDYKPSYLGQLSFYLEALDRDVKKLHEKPSIGVLLCKSKDETVVEYSLSNTLSPALIAEYETKFINKQLMQSKIQEFLELNLSFEDK